MKIGLQAKGLFSGLIKTFVIFLLLQWGPFFPNRELSLFEPVLLPTYVYLFLLIKRIQKLYFQYHNFLVQNVKFFMV